MAGFIGRYEHSLDAKGRVILPVGFRASFEHGGYLTEYSGGCLALWTLGEFDRQLEQVQAQYKEGRITEDHLRYLASASKEVEVDRQGRMAIPSSMREFASLESEVLVNGVIDRLELWNPTKWRERVPPGEAWLLGGGRGS